MLKFPDINHPYEERSESKEKDLTDPPVLKKGNMKPLTHKNSNKESASNNKIADLIEKTQSEFAAICRQLITIQEKQEGFNNFIAEQMQRSTPQVKSHAITNSSALPASTSPEDI